MLSKKGGSRGTDWFSGECLSRAAARRTEYSRFLMQTSAKVRKDAAFSASYSRIGFDEAYHPLLGQILAVTANQEERAAQVRTRRVYRQTKILSASRLPDATRRHRDSSSCLSKIWDGCSFKLNILYYTRPSIKMSSKLSKTAGQFLRFLVIL